MVTVLGASPWATRAWHPPFLPSSCDPGRLSPMCSAGTHFCREVSAGVPCASQTATPICSCRERLVQAKVQAWKGLCLLAHMTVAKASGLRRKERGQEDRLSVLNRELNASILPLQWIFSQEILTGLVMPFWWPPLASPIIGQRISPPTNFSPSLPAFFPCFLPPLSPCLFFPFFLMFTPSSLLSTLPYSYSLLSFNNL